MAEPKHSPSSDPERAKHPHTRCSSNTPAHLPALRRARSSSERGKVSVTEFAQDTEEPAEARNLRRVKCDTSWFHTIYLISGRNKPEVSNLEASNRFGRSCATFPITALIKQLGGRDGGLCACIIFRRNADRPSEVLTALIRTPGRLSLYMWH